MPRFTFLYVIGIFSKSSVALLRRGRYYDSIDSPMIGTSKVCDERVAKLILFAAYIFLLKLFLKFPFLF